jgi:hypothetical protein
MVGDSNSEITVSRSSRELGGFGVDGLQIVAFEDVFRARFFPDFVKQTHRLTILGSCF